MLSQTPEELPAILFVDDEEKTCKHFKRLFSNRFRILTANDGLQGMEIFREKHRDIGVIVTDQRMPNETGTEFLLKASHLKPSVKRILSTAYADVDSAVDAVNNGGIYRYITKPWDVAELEVTLMRAMEVYLLEKEREDLLSRKVAGVEVLAAIERVHSLAALAVFKESGLRHVSPAIGTLIQLGQNEGPPPAPAQWEAVYQNHRQFLDLANAALPGHVTKGDELDPRQTLPVDEIFNYLSTNQPRLTVHAGEGKQQTLPGPITVLGPLVDRLIQGLAATLSATDQIHLHHSPTGPELHLSDLPVRHALRPLFSSQPTAISDAQPCLNLTAAILNWHHHGGQLTINSDSAESGTLRLGLSIQTPGIQVDPWRHLASDLIANASFWKRQL